MGTRNFFSAIIIMAKHKPYEKMNALELKTATAEYDKPWAGPSLPGKPLTTSQRRQHRQAAKRAKARRMKIGQGI
jgi:hypothetical protein